MLIDKVNQTPLREDHPLSRSRVNVTDWQIGSFEKVAPQRRTALLRAWTRKEAYAKATGEGLFDGLQEIELALDAALPKASLMVCPFQRDQNAMRAWTIHELSAPEGLGAALAVEQK